MFVPINNNQHKEDKMNIKVTNALHPKFTREQVLRMLVALYWQFNSEDSIYPIHQTDWGQALRFERDALGLEDLSSLGCRHIDEIIKLIATERQYVQFWDGTHAEDVEALLLPDGVPLSDEYRHRFVWDVDGPGISDCEGDMDCVKWRARQFCPDYTEGYDCGPVVRDAAGWELLERGLWRCEPDSQGESDKVLDEWGYNR